MLQTEKQDTAGYAAAIVMTCAMLALWGFAHRFYAMLLPDLAKALSLSPYETDVARAAVAIGYFVMGLPAAFISRNFGYKIGALFGLGLFSVGMFLLYSAVTHRSFVFILIAASVIGSGLVIVQVTLSPLIVFLGHRDSAVLRLTLAQSLIPIGSLAALLLGQKFLAQDVTHPALLVRDSLVWATSLVGVAAIALAFIVEMVNFPTIAGARIGRNDSTWKTFLPLLKNASFRDGVIAQFLALLAQIIVAGLALQYCSEVFPDLSPAAQSQILFAALAAFALGRLIAAALMLMIAPMTVLVLYCIASTMAAGLLVVVSGWGAIAALLACAFFLSVQFPAILGQAIRDMGETAKSAAAVMIFFAFSATAFFAVATLMYHPSAIRLVMILPALCLAGTTIYALRLRRSEKSSIQSTSNPQSPKADTVPVV